MKLKRFFKRMNRGIALLIITVIAFSGYLVVDAIAFEGQKDSITEFITTYIEEFPQMNLLPEEYREAGKEVSEEEVAEDKKQENLDFINSYWLKVENNNGYSWGDIEHMKNYVIDDLYENHILAQTQGVVLESEANVQSVTDIKKLSSNSIQTTVKYSIVVNVIGNGGYYNGGYDVQYGEYNYEMTEDADLTEDKSIKLNMEAQYIITNTSVGYKITNIQNAYSTY